MESTDEIVQGIESAAAESAYRRAQEALRGAIDGGERVRDALGPELAGAKGAFARAVAAVLAARHLDFQDHLALVKGKVDAMYAALSREDGFAEDVDAITLAIHAYALAWQMADGDIDTALANRGLYVEPLVFGNTTSRLIRRIVVTLDPTTEVAKDWRPEAPS